MIKKAVLLLFFIANVFANEKLIDYTKSCDSGNLSDCIHLGIMYFIADGVEEDFVKSETLFKEACKGRVAQGCYYLGYIYKRGGKGIKQNKLKAKLAFGRACNIGSEKSCVQFRRLEAKGI